MKMQRIFCLFICKKCSLPLIFFVWKCMISSTLLQWVIRLSHRCVPVIYQHVLRCSVKWAVVCNDRFFRLLKFYYIPVVKVVFYVFDKYKTQDVHFAFSTFDRNNICFESKNVSDSKKYFSRFKSNILNYT